MNTCTNANGIPNAAAMQMQLVSCTDCCIASNKLKYTIVNNYFVQHSKDSQTGSGKSHHIR